jgi:hypothetical protein
VQKQAVPPRRAHLNIFAAGIFRQGRPHCLCTQAQQSLQLIGALLQVRRAGHAQGLQERPHLGRDGGRAARAELEGAHLLDSGDGIALQEQAAPGVRGIAGMQIP